jgi:hypothetical protein
MRKMPQGQWVAWEGYDHVHECKRPPERRTTDEWQKTHGPQVNPYGGLGFDEVDVGGYKVPSGMPAPEASTSTSRRRGGRSARTGGRRKSYAPRPVVRSDYGTPQTDSTDWGSVLGVLIVIVVVLLCLSGNCSG